MADMAKLLSNIDPALIAAQEEHEDAIKSYLPACEIHADALVNYRQKKSDRTIFHKQHGEKATNIRDIVQGETLEEKRELLVAEGKKKQVEKWINAYELRVNTLKFVARKIDPGRYHQ